MAPTQIHMMPMPRASQGRGFSETAPVSSVGRDGPGNVYVPLTAADWVSLGLVAPGWQWNCQDTATPLAAAIGSITLAAQGAGGHVYQQSVTGWTRKFVGYSAETANARFSTTDTALDAAIGESVAWLIYVSASLASASVRGVLQVSATPNNSIMVTTLAYRQSHNAVNNTMATVPDIATVVPAIWYRNATTDVSGLIMPGDHVTATTHEEAAFAASTTKGLGMNGANSATARYCLAASWKGVDAETIAVPATLTTLGW